MNTEQLSEKWQVESNGQVIDTNFAEITSWIEDETLLRMDRVRKGNLRWIEAGRVRGLPRIRRVTDPPIDRGGEPPPAIRAGGGRGGVLRRIDDMS